MLHVFIENFEYNYNIVYIIRNSFIANEKSKVNYLKTYEYIQHSGHSVMLIINYLNNYINFFVLFSINMYR